MPDAPTGTIRLILLTFLLVLLGSSCRHAPTPAHFAASVSGYQQRPQIWLEYYPYPLPGGPPALTGVRPLPDYHDSWTNQRMRRDLERIAATGVDVILLFLAPEKIGDPFFCERVRQFFTLGAELTPALQIVVTVATYAPLRLDYQNVMDFFQTQEFARQPNYLQFKGQRPLFFSENIQLLGRYSGIHSAIQFGADLPSRPYDASGLSKKNGAIWIKAAHIAAEQTDIRGKAWLIPRSHGLALNEKLCQAFSQLAPIIILSSWNNFSDGSFLEPNSFDQGILLQTLQAAVAALRPSPAP